MLARYLRAYVKTNNHDAAGAEACWEGHPAAWHAPCPYRNRRTAGNLNATSHAQSWAYSTTHRCHKCSAWSVTPTLCRVGGGFPIPAPHRLGRAEYPHPVLHAGNFANETAYSWTILAAGCEYRASMARGSAPRQIAVAATPCEPLSPYPRDLVVVPSDAPAVSGDAIRGRSAPDHP